MDKVDSITPYLGKYLIHQGLISTDDLDKACSLQSRSGGRLGPILIRIGAISEENLLQALSTILQTPLLQEKDMPQDLQSCHDVMRLSGIDLEWWLDQEVVAWMSPKGNLCCALRDPFNDSIIEILHDVFDEQILQFYLIRTYDLEKMLEGISRSVSTMTYSDSDINQLRELAEEAPVIEFVNNLISQAFEQRASDIHIEPGEHSLEMRFRIDGILYKRFTLSIERYAAISSRIKLISGMDIAERRLPQDGRLEIRLSGGTIDIRVSSVPGINGESIVLRLLPKEGKKLDLESLGMVEDYLEVFRKWIREPHGIILLTGPTGSGKSTTLYSVLEEINDGLKKIITVEDPVEYHIKGVSQIQTHSEIGYTFARALRSILRQDPDVILIGEIRDKETAEIAVQASLTGHLVLSTLHTNDALSAFTRLIDMGLEPFLVATPIRAVMAQRLVRRLCPFCARPSEPVEDIKTLADTITPGFLLNKEPEWRNANGCPECQGTGYQGREAIYEMVEVTPEMQHLILNDAPIKDMRRLAKEQKFRTLREDGIIKARQGITSIDEVLRVTAT